VSFLDDYLGTAAGNVFVTGTGDEHAAHLVPEPLINDIALSVTKMSGYLEVPEEMLMDFGVIPDTRPKPVLTRREQFARWRRRRINSARLALAGRAYRLISGEDVPEPEDW
jgi:hypothetical protein